MDYSIIEIVGIVGAGVFIGKLATRIVIFTLKDVAGIGTFQRDRALHADLAKTHIALQEINVTLKEMQDYLADLPRHDVVIDRLEMIQERLGD